MARDTQNPVTMVIVVILWSNIVVKEGLPFQPKKISILDLVKTLTIPIRPWLLISNKKFRPFAIRAGRGVILLHPTRIAPALLGLRQALKISIYDYLPKFHQINAELFLNCNDAIIFIGSSSILV